MKKRFRITLVAGLIMLSVHRLPAPIQEIPETPTPPPKSAPVEETKQSRKPKPSAEQRDETRARTRSRTSSANRFAGVWVGQLNFSIMGNVEETLIVNSTGNAVTERNQLGNATHESTWDGATIRFQGGAINEIEFTLTPSADGQTAIVTANSPFIANPGAAFRKKAGVAANSVAAPAAFKTAGAPNNSGGAPVAKPVPGKPGFVYNPFEPTAKMLLDVRGKTSGARVKDPSGRLFIVP